MPERTHKGDAESQRAGLNQGVSWDDLRVFIACFDARSFRSAARILVIDSATVIRRVERLERQIGAALFHRVSEGIVPTAEAKRIINDARAMEKASFNIVRQTKLGGEEIKGLVRVSITEGLGTYWVLPRLLDFLRANHALTIELQCTMLPTDVGRLEADISIQFTKPERPDVVTARLGYLHVYPFASVDYVNRFGQPKSVAEIRDHRIIQQVSPLLDESAYARSLGVESVEGIVGVRTNASTAVLYAIERDAGIGMLPTYAPALGAKLAPIDIGIRARHDLWMTYHPDLRQSPRHRVVIDWLRRIFDPKRFPCFGEEFIHPHELVPLMSKDALVNYGAGFAAAFPFLVNKDQVVERTDRIDVDAV